MFCTKCGARLEEDQKFCPICGQMVKASGEKKSAVSGQGEEPKPQISQEKASQSYDENRADFFTQTEKKTPGVPERIKRMKKGMAIVNIVFGALLILVGLADADYDWGLIAIASGTGILVAGILQLRQKGNKVIGVIEIVFGAVTLFLGCLSASGFVWSEVGILSGIELLVNGILERLNKAPKAKGIVEIVFGGILLLDVSGYDWGAIALLLSAAFLTGGILKLRIISISKTAKI